MAETKKVRVTTIRPKADKKFGHTFTLDWDALAAALDRRARAGGHHRPGKKSNGGKPS